MEYLPKNNDKVGTDFTFHEKYYLIQVSKNVKGLVKQKSINSEWQKYGHYIILSFNLCILHFLILKIKRGCGKPVSNLISWEYHKVLQTEEIQEQFLTLK